MKTPMWLMHYLLSSKKFLKWLAGSIPYIARKSVSLTKDKKLQRFLHTATTVNLLADSLGVFHYGSF